MVVIKRPGIGIERVMGWLWRYVPAELVCTPTALLFAWAATVTLGNPALVALAATWGENLGFYGMMLAREIRAQRSLRSIPHTIMRLALEFGPAEGFDSLLLRPCCMYLGLTLIDNAALGILVGKLAADISFYLLAIISYEYVCSRLRG